MVTILPLEPQQWMQHKTLRLRALLDSPDAFGSTYEAECIQSDSQWELRIATALAQPRNKAFIAYHDHQACGLVWCQLVMDNATTAELFQMWVAPEQRGLGAGKHLLNAAIQWLQAVGVQRIQLGVTQTNTAAIRLYQGYGFTAVGEPSALRDGSPLLSQTMLLTLAP